MKKNTPLILSLALMVIMQACSSAEITKIKRLRIEEKEINDQPRLFSTFGFWILEEEERRDFLSLYHKSGKLNRENIITAFPTASTFYFNEGGMAARIELGNKNITEVYLAEDWLISLDPKFDKLIQAATLGPSHNRLPIVPIVPK